jgi:hypothetical protein
MAPVAKPSGLERQPDAVVIHGRGDLKRLVDTEWIRQEVGVPFQWLDGPSVDGEHVALGLAQGAFQEEAASFDLAREYREPPRLSEMFPWHEATLYVAMLFMLAAFFWFQKSQVTRAYSAALDPNSQSACTTVCTSDLEREKKDLQARVSTVRRFLDSRVLWTACFRELSSSLPDSVYLTSLSGDAELKRPGKGKAAAKRSLVVKGAVSLPESGLIPHEVDRVVNAIRENPLITKDFPVIELADLQQVRLANDDRESAMFSLVCVPKEIEKKK